MKRALRLGITGKISSGKSLCSSWLRDSGISVLDADAIAKEIMQTNAEVRTELIQLFGETIYSNNTLDTKRLAAALFNNNENRVAVEKLVHPIVIEEFFKAFEKAQEGSIIGVESAIMFQTGFDDVFDIVLLINASDEQIIERNKAGKRFTDEDLKSRLAIQSFTKEMEQWADFVIENDSTKENFIQRCSTIMEIVKIIALGDLPEESLRIHEDEDPQ